MTGLTRLSGFVRRTMDPRVGLRPPRNDELKCLRTTFVIARREAPWRSKSGLKHESPHSEEPRERRLELRGLSCALWSPSSFETCCFAALLRMRG